ncbi:MAG TPA: NAD(P)/FAD-dependent oxidoreductase [Ilumatobacteraceae bacterium]|nr:NAD(P)/FAD-dependent oxidoreductase [Ilumatobacteraceae bacterium]
MGLDMYAYTLPKDVDRPCVDFDLDDIPGRDTFAGTAFHSGAWKTDHRLDGERVAVVGSAASAVQLIPQIAKVVGRLHVFQRSANWVMPKEDTPFTAEQLAAFVADPTATDALRDAAFEVIGHTKPFANPESRSMAEQAGLFNLRVVSDPDLRQRLTPTVPWGCQRPLFSNDYYPTFNRDNVELVTDAITHITPAGIVTADGQERAVDTIIFATGYETTRYVSAIEITGRDGLALNQAWAEGAEAYLGISTTGFPNLFMLYGPNTNHGSIIYMIECQVDYVVRMLQRMDADGVRAIDVRADVMAEFNEQLQRDLDEVTVWDGGCRHYYRVASGRIVTQWPHALVVYRDLTDDPAAIDAYERL